MQWLTSRAPSAPVGFVFLFNLLIAAGVLSDRVMGLDTGWHLAAGRWMATNGALPASDPWSFTAGETPWYNLAWGFDLGIHLLEANLGFGGLAAITLLIFAALPAAVAAVLLDRGVGLTATLVVSLSVGLLTCEAINVRPQMMSYVLALAIYVVLTRDRSDPQPANVALFALFALIWANTHGAFLMSFILLGAFGVESLVQRDWGRAKRLTGFAAVGGIATLFNPHGANLVGVTYLSLGSVLKPFIQEWDPIVIGSDIPQTLFLVLLVLGWNLRSSRVPLADKLITLGMLLLGLTSIRHSVLFALLAAPTVAILLDDAIDALPFAERLRAKEAEYFADLTSWKGRIPFTAIGLIAAAVMLIPGLRSSVVPGLETYPSPTKSTLPVMDALASKHPGLRTLNEYDIGGHIVYRHPGDIRVFADGRVETSYPREVMEDYLRLMQNEDGWMDILERYDIEAALLRLSMAEQVAYLESAGWYEVARDERYVALVRPDQVK